jgi:hypothetical protein
VADTVRPRVDEYAETACEATGLDDFGATTWRDGLECLVDSLQHDAGLNELGVAVTDGEITNYLTDRLRIVADANAHPERASVDVVPPIVIVGQARTGTTILHDLLAQDPATRVPLTWEVDRPCPPPEAATYNTDPRIAEVDATLAGVDLVLPEFRTMHPMGARLPQECVRITASDFRSMIFPTQYRVPTYARWLIDDADMQPAYQWHRRFLQHLQSHVPAERWVLKSPGHIWCLGDLLAEYPNALLVQTHRDPLRIIASVSSLIATLRTLASDRRPISEVAVEFSDYLIDGLNRSVTAREDGTVDAKRVVDVHFSAFMRDPFATIHSIYDALGLELTNATEGKMRAFLAEHGQDEHGGHRYSFADTELDVGALRERTRRYQDYFAVPDEPLS